MSKNIKIITYGNFPYGGASANFLRNFSLSLSLENNDVEVILPTGGYFGKEIDANIKRRGEVENVKYIHTGFIRHPRNYIGKVIDNFLGPLLMFFTLIIKNTYRSIDVIFVYNTSLSQTFLILILKRITNSKYIVILPEFYSKPRFKKVSLNRLRWWNYIKGMKLIKKADGYIVLSHYLNNYIVNELNGQAKIFLLPNVLDPSIFNLRGIKPFKSGKITIGYVGTPTRKDGAKDLIKSFSELNKKHDNLHLLIIGDITNGQTLIPELRKLAKEYDSIRNITFTGLVSFSEIPSFLNACQILALTRPNGRFAEAGFPTKLGEYFACKKPVVVTKVGDISKYFKNKEHVMLVEPENIADIVSGFEALILDKNLGTEIAENAYIWMDNHLNYRNISKNLDEFVNNV